MTTETMTIHKALAELKVLDSRIKSAVNNCDFVSTKKNNQDNMKGKTVEQFSSKVRDTFKSISDLIVRRNAIKEAVVASNATTLVKVGDTEYTVAKAIEKKNHGMDYYVQLRNILKFQLAENSELIERHNVSLQQKAEQFVTGLMGNKESKSNNDDYNVALNSYIKANTMALVDPIGIEKEIEKLDHMIDSFLPEVDAALSCSNAMTTITVEY